MSGPTDTQRTTKSICTSWDWDAILCRYKSLILCMIMQLMYSDVVGAL
jgi:hypothetical protein